MSKLKRPVEYEGKDIASDAAAFLESQFGAHVIRQLNVRYNELHHQAEDQTLTAEQKAMRVEQAVGVKWCLNYVLERAKAHRDGLWERQEAKAKQK